MDQEMAYEDRGSRNEDVDLTHSTYELTRELGPSAFRDKISVLNITDVTLAVLVLPLSYADDTLGAISARLATPESAQIRWAMQEGARRGSAPVYSLDRRSDLVLYDDLNVNVSEVLLVVTQSYEGAVSVLDARRVSATENLVLAVLPGLLLEGSGIVPLQPGGMVETIVGEILDRMVETPRDPECDAVAQPPVKVMLTFATAGLGSPGFGLEAGVRDTMGSIRDRLGAHGVANGQDAYICHNGKLLGDDCVLSDLEFWEYKGFSAGQSHLVLSMYLLPGRVQGRLSHIPESGRAFDSPFALTKTEVLFTWSGALVRAMSTHPLSNVRHLKIYAIREIIVPPPGGYGRPLREHSNLSLSVASRPLEDDSCPLQFFAEELLHNESKLNVHTPLDEAQAIYAPSYKKGGRVSLGPSFSGNMLRPQWPWKRLRLPLEEREFDGRYVNDFDVRTFKKYSSRVVFVNRTSRTVHISCFPTWSKDSHVSSTGVSVGIGGWEVGANGEIGTTIRYFEGYGAVDDPCLAPLGAYDTVNIAKGLVREMSVVFGVESEDGSHIDYKRLKNVKGGQQVDVLKAFVDKRPKYTHPTGQPSKEALAAHFLPNV